MSAGYELKDHVVVITGAGQGIGRAYAHAFAGAGAIPAIADINAAAGDKVAAEIRAKGKRAESIAVDISSPESVAALVAATLKIHGRIDTLINNASIF